MNRNLFKAGRAAGRGRSGHVVVLGLGRFGRAFVREALALGYEVVAVDADQAVVDDLADEFPCCLQADSTSRRVLETLSVEDAELVLVATGSDVEASLLTVSALVDLKTPRIWAKARSARHRDILLKVGAHRVTQPETSEGVRLAHQLRDGTREYVPLDESFSIVEVEAPGAIVGRSLGELQSRERFAVSVVALKHPDGRFSHADPHMVVERGDLLVVLGAPRDAERFLADS
jgi:trk system potassium uptake protein TrkA